MGPATPRARGKRRPRQAPASSRRRLTVPVCDADANVTSPSFTRRADRISVLAHPSKGSATERQAIRAAKCGPNRLYATRIGATFVRKIARDLTPAGARRVGGEVVRYLVAATRRCTRVRVHLTRRSLGAAARQGVAVGAAKAGSAGRAGSTVWPRPRVGVWPRPGWRGAGRGGVVWVTARGHRSRMPRIRRLRKPAHTRCAWHRASAPGPRNYPHRRIGAAVSARILR
jgi:hypothetical protein